MSFFQMPSPVAARRLFLGRTGLTLSGAAVAMLAGHDALAAKAGGGAAQDVQILNTALGAELEAIAAYQLGAESQLLQAPVLALALTFQGHHKEHADVLAKTVLKLGGKPVQAKSQYAFPVEQLKSQADVLTFAAGHERAAVSASLGAVPLFGNRDLAKAAASILGDEAMHWAWAPAVRAAGDAARGEAIYARCLACHALAIDRIGPRHCGLVGRRAGSVPGFDCSPAMKRSAITWNAAALDVKRQGVVS